MEAEMGVEVHETPRDVMEAQLAAWSAVLDRYASEDEFFAKVLDSQQDFASRVVPLKARLNPPADIALKHFGFE